MPATGEYPLRLVDFDNLEPVQRENEGLKPLLEELLGELRARKRRAARIVVRTGGKTVFLRTDEVDWVEASGNYVRLHAKGEAFVLRDSMKNMEVKLDPDLFVRIHRSAIVNVDRIRELQPWFHGEYVVILQDGTKLMASRVSAIAWTGLSPELERETVFHSRVPELESGTRESFRDHALAGQDRRLCHLSEDQLQGERRRRHERRPVKRAAECFRELDASHRIGR